MTVPRVALVLLVVAAWYQRLAADEIPTKSSTNTTKSLENRVDTLRGKLRVNVSTVDLSQEARWAATDAATLLGAGMQDRLTKLYTNANSTSCRAKIAEHFGYFINAIAKEESLPFTDVSFPNECGETVYDWNHLPEGMHIGDVQNRSYQPPRNESVYIDDSSHLKLLYVILTHDNAAATIRLVEAVHEPDLHQFVIHVDAKYDKTQQALLDYSIGKEYIHMVPDYRRVRVNWGGFSMVNATLQAMQFAFALDPNPPNHSTIDFHKLIHLSSSSYPLASNQEIRHKLASYPLDANFLHVIMQPTRPGNYGWHYFVECDDALHRIFQLPPLRREVAGIDMYTSSQWFIVSHEFAKYLAEAKPGSMVAQYLRYIEHVVVADETFFGTVLRHTEYCHKHHNTNFLHLQFDRWESELPAAKRDARKCPMPDPDHCGRSPTTMTLDYADILELSDDLFARKFDDSIDTEVKVVVDRWRRSRSDSIELEGKTPEAAFVKRKMDFEGHGVLIVAKDTLADTTPLCLAIGLSGNKVQLLPCFEDWVPPTLAEDWERGAVVLHETVPHARWDVGPCTSDGLVERLSTGEMNVTLGNYSVTGPRCMLQQMDGVRAGRCYDGGAMGLQPGGETQVYPCIREWFQFVSFGDGRVAPKGSLFSTMPSHIVKQIRNLGHDQIAHMCLGVYERGNDDEIDWNDKEYKSSKKERATMRTNSSFNEQDWEALSEWTNASIITTQCSNTGGVIEWVFVPFIEEEVASEEATEAEVPETNTTVVPKSDDSEL